MEKDLGEDFDEESILSEQVRDKITDTDKKENAKRKEEAKKEAKKEVKKEVKKDAAVKKEDGKNNTGGSTKNVQRCSAATAPAAKKAKVGPSGTRSVARVVCEEEDDSSDSQEY